MNLEFRISRSADLCPYALITRSRVFAGQRGSDGQKISGPFYAEKVTPLIFPVWPSFKIRRSLEFPGFQSTETHRDFEP
jgi:hypothetical protein